MGTRPRRIGIVALMAAMAVVAGAVGAVATQPSSPARATTTVVNETFSDHANNWNAAAGTWGITSTGRYSNCLPAGCSGTGVQRSWLGFASNAASYTIDADVWINGSAEQCKVIYTGANTGENYRVDLRRATNSVVVVAGSNSWSYTPSGGHAALAGSGAKYHLTLAVAQTSLTVGYKQGTETQTNVLSVNPNAIPDGKIGIGSYNGTCDVDNVVVTADEGVGNGSAQFLPILGYERTEACNEGPANPNKPNEELTEAQCDRPLFAPWNRDSSAWWSEMVDEFSQAGFTGILAHNRGCWTDSPTELHGSGDMCPNQLTKLETALTDRSSSIKVGMFDDFPTAADQYRTDTSQTLDLSNHTLWQKYFWDDRWNRFYATIPRTRDYTVGGRPLIAIWSPANEFSNTQGNLSQLIDYLRGKVQAAYGFNPFIIVHSDFYAADTTLNGHVDAVVSWFDQSTHTNTVTPATYGSYTGATVVPSYRYPHNTPGCGGPCLELPRSHGNSLISALYAQRNTSFVQLEGWTNVIEGAGYYRSLEGNDPNGCTLAGDANTLDFPNQDINILKRFVNPTGSTVVLQAEAADTYVSTNASNIGGAYRLTSVPGSSCVYNTLSVRQIGTGNNYAVGDVNGPGTRLGFRDLYLPGGSYTLNVRYATPNSDAQVCMSLGGSASQCSTVPSTGSYTAYSTASFGPIPVHKGLLNVNLLLPTASGINIDSITVHQ